MAERPPITAVAFFFDDIRVEIGNKLTFVGQYSPQMFITDPNFPMDRLAVWLHVRWPLTYQPSNLAMRIDLPGQPQQQYQDIPVEMPKSGASTSPFACNVMQSVVQVRFPGLRIGDNIDVWVRADGHEFPAGRVSVIAPPNENVSAAPS